MPTTDSPCHGCADRQVTPNCHDTCERYKTWAATERGRRRKYTEHERMVDEVMSKSYDRQRKKCREESQRRRRNG